MDEHLLIWLVQAPITPKVIPVDITLTLKHQLERISILQLSTVPHWNKLQLRAPWTSGITCSVPVSENLIFTLFRVTVWQICGPNTAIKVCMSLSFCFWILIKCLKHYFHLYTIDIVYTRSFNLSKIWNSKSLKFQFFITAHNFASMVLKLIIFFL